MSRRRGIPYKADTTQAIERTPSKVDAPKHKPVIDFDIEMMES